MTKKAKKITAAVTLAVFMSGMVSVLAIDRDSLTSTLYMSDVCYPNEVVKYVNGNAYRSSNGGPVVYGETAEGLIDEDGNVLDFGYFQKAVRLENDVFDKAIPYMCYGVEGSSTSSGNENQIRIKLNSPVTIEETDGLYFSFYYRAAESFCGAGEKSSILYTGKTSQVVVYGPDNANQSVNIIGDTQTNINSSKVAIVPDGKWHRLDATMYMKAQIPAGGKTNYEKLVDKDIFNFAINLNQIYDPAYIEFAGFRVGVLKSTEAFEAGCEANQMQTEINWHLQKKTAEQVTVNGTPLDLSESSHEYMIDGTLDTPEIEVKSDDGLKYELEKLAYDRYALTTYGPGYDLAKSPEETVGFKERFNNNSFSGSWKYPKAVNGEFVNTYYININIPLIQAELTVGGVKTNSLEGAAKGDTIELSVSYINAEQREYNYLTLLVIRNGQRVISIVPYSVTVAENEESKTETHSYVLPDRDYTGNVVDYLIIDRVNMNDVSK